MIDKKDAIECLQALGFDVRELPNGYHLQLRLEEHPEWFFDWYITTGSLVCNRKGTYYRAIIIKDAERANEYVRKKIEEINSEFTPRNGD